MIKKLIVFIFIIIFSLSVVKAVFAQRANSNCVVVKVGNPSSQQILPQTCSASSDNSPGLGSATNCEAGTDAGIGDGYRDGVLTKIKLCNVQGIIVNSQISKNVDQLLTAAKNSGISLSGGGFRTMASQKSLFAKNCGGGSCRPPTARPGYSNHQMGLAIDFTYNGRLIVCSGGISAKTCRSSGANKGFNWLDANAIKYGLKNFPKEAWHWSIDGR